VEFNFSESGSYNLPSWQESFSAPSVVPGGIGTATSFSSPSLNFSNPSFNAFDYAQSYQAQPTSSNWMDYLKAGGLALSAAGDAIRAFRGEPTPPGSSPFQQYLAQEEQKESDKRLAQLLKDAMGASSTEPITGVLDPAAERRSQGSFFGALPSLAGIGSSTGTRMAGSFLS
jgi:hypothetical protein